MISIKTPAEIQAMREGGKILAEILHELALTAKIGVTTEELNTKAEALMSKYRVLPSFKNYRGYPASICTSINEEVVHAIPCKRILNDGDILKIDCGVFYKGMHTDAAVCVMLGNVPEKTRNFVLNVQKALEKGIAEVKPNARIGDIGFAIHRHITNCDYSVVHEYIGHGIGKSLHEEPEVPNEGKKGKGPLLLPGMTIAIEPIIAMGERFIDVLKDKWTSVTRDGMPSCQIEHTVLVTTTGCEVLTKYNNTTFSVYAH